MNTLITGGTGFLGLNIAEELLRNGQDVILLSDGELPDYARRELSKHAGALTSASVDVADDAAVDATFAEHRPGRVVHAAVITAGEQRERYDFDRIVDVNIKGTGHVLSAAAKYRTPRVVYVSSGSAYGLSLLNAATVAEDTPAYPDTLYSITKYASERMCARFRRLCGLDVVCARLGSVFGPWERDTGVRDSLSLPFQIVRRTMRNEEIVLPRREPRRDWIYSRDAAAAIACLLSAAGLTHELYNVASGAEWRRFAEGCCLRLRSIFPQLRYRIAAEGEAANISFLGETDRALMSKERLLADTGFRVTTKPETVFDGYAQWLEKHRAYLNQAMWCRT